MDFVAGHGDLGLLWAMHDEDDAYPWSCTPAAMDKAAAGGHLHVVQWLAENRTEGCTEAAVDAAARNGRVAVMHWLATTYGVSPKPSTFLAALEGGHVESLEWLEENATLAMPTPAQALDAACVLANRLAVLKWLESKKSIRLATKTAMSSAIGHGDVATAKWLASGTPGGKNVELWNRVVARWMSYEFGLMHGDTFATAALHGHREIVEWLARTGPFYKVHTDTLWQCAMRGHLDVVTFILQHQVHQPEDLEFLPASWSSFTDAFEGDTTSGGLRRDWQRLASEPAWAKVYVALWLQHRPDDCRCVSWLAAWAWYGSYRDLHAQLTR